MVEIEALLSRRWPPLLERSLRLLVAVPFLGKAHENSDHTAVIAVVHGQLEKQGTGTGMETGTENGNWNDTSGLLCCLFHFASNHQTEASDSVVGRSGQHSINM